MTPNTQTTPQTLREAVAFISTNWQSQPSLDEIASSVGMEQRKFQRFFTSSLGLSPKEYLQCVTLDHAKPLLNKQSNILDTSLELGMSGPSRLHDLFISHEGMSPGAYKLRGAGLQISYGFFESPFGIALLMVNEARLMGLAFCEEGDKPQALDDMQKRWPHAEYVENAQVCAPFLNRIFNKETWGSDQPLRIVMIGTDFEIKVWEALVKIPFGEITSYGKIAQNIGMPKAARAVGAAVGRNPISFVVPCHRVLGKSGKLTGYHWGVTRKRAILGWEFGTAQKP